MFRQFTYRLVPFMLGLIPGPPPRGGTTITEVTETGIDAKLTADVDRPDRGDVPGWVLITLVNRVYCHPRVSARCARTVVFMNGVYVLPSMAETTAASSSRSGSWSEMIRPLSIRKFSTRSGNCMAYANGRDCSPI